VAAYRALLPVLQGLVVGACCRLKSIVFGSVDCRKVDKDGTVCLRVYKQIGIKKNSRVSVSRRLAIIVVNISHQQQQQHFTFGGRDIKVVDVSRYVCCCECRIMTERIKNVKFPRLGISGSAGARLRRRKPLLALLACWSWICLNVLFFSLRRRDPAFSIPRNSSC
jgi:hypothetical protein